MICCIVLKPRLNYQALFLNRQKQEMINSHITSQLSYKPFVFNSSRGIYIFTKKTESFEKIEGILYQFFSDSELEKVEILDTSSQLNFFSIETKRVLQSKHISAFAWKRFISSFLIQINPFSPKTDSDSIAIFHNFKTSIRKNGSRIQKKYFKRKLKILRKRVSLDSLDDLLKLD